MKTTTAMKRKILEISLYEGGIAEAATGLQSEKDGQRLAAAFVSLAQEDELFKGALLGAVMLMLGHPEEVKAAHDAAKASAIAKMFGNNKAKS